MYESDNKPCVELKSGDRVRQSAPRQKPCQLSGLAELSWSQISSNQSLGLSSGDQSEEVFRPSQPMSGFTCDTFTNERA